MTPEELSLQLREGIGGFLWYRRGVICCGLVAAACMAFITLYQFGIIRHLPDPPFPRMNADKVDSSPEAYSKLWMPDAFIGFASYAVTMMLTAMAGADRATERPWIPLLLAAKVGFDATQAGKLSYDQ